MYTAPCPAWSALAASTPGPCPPTVTLSVRHQHLPWYLQKCWLCTDCVWHRRYPRVRAWSPSKIYKWHSHLYPYFLNISPYVPVNLAINRLDRLRLLKYPHFLWAFIVEYVSCAHFTCKKCHVVVMKYYSICNYIFSTRPSIVIDCDEKLRFQIFSSI